MKFVHPILTCAEAAALETRLLGGDSERAWDAMFRAGAGVGAGVLRDFAMWRLPPRDPRVLVLAGPGHNGGDALLAARELLRARPRGRATVVLLEPPDRAKPLTRRAYEMLLEHESIELCEPARLPALFAAGATFDVTLDGLFGMSFRPPLPDPARALIEVVNSHLPAAGFRAAVDVPSGVGDAPADFAFAADFTYATGSVKAALFAAANARWAGRIRYVDLGFFTGVYEGAHAGGEDVILPCVLEPLARLRPAQGDKRDYGELLVISGSRAYPGAQMLNVLGALRAGAGLVTALAPAAHAGAFAAARPEAMWRACAEEPDGGHGAAALAAARELWPRAAAALIGSGMGRGAHTAAVVQTLARECPGALVLDADALQPATLAALAERPARFGAVILTPHAGEFARLGGRPETVRDFCRAHQVVVVLKGPVTRVADAQRVWCSTAGGPVLARGGSGDVLAGVAAALLAQTPGDAFLAAARAAQWHGLAADALARHRGETAALTAELANFLPDALRGE